MLCPNPQCNQNIKNDSVYCPFCGGEISRMQAQQATKQSGPKVKPSSGPRRFNPLILITSLISLVLVLGTMRDAVSITLYSIPVLIFCTGIPLFKYYNNPITWKNTLGLIIMQNCVLAWDTGLIFVILTIKWGLEPPL